MERQNQSLRFNPKSGYYEDTFTMRVEAEIFRRVLFSHAEDNNIDPADLAAWKRTIDEISNTNKWLSHPRASIVAIDEIEVQQEILQEPKEPKEPEEPEKTVASTKYLSLEEEEK